MAKLSKKAAREETGLFLLEGPQAVAEALNYRPELLLELYATPTALERYADVGQTAVDAGLDVEFVTEEVLDQLADTVTPQGFVAVARQFPVSVRDVFQAEPALVAILEEVRDPGNLGTIIRVADAAGADAVILTGRSVDLYNPKVVRATTGSLFHIPVAVGQELAPTLDRARQAGMRAVAADVKGRSLVEAGDVLRGSTAWVFGNEARGLNDDALALVDDVVRVPIFGKAESMNLATAASVCLYQSAFATRLGN
ncbi:putative rRNA methylase [Mycetocola reblochoni REB411]|uniref:Putative rRNA methylase n=1 Tax=Mycetocola reblochoni REB411 TaxID=1255698 RepID=A0A1R4IDY6_9MICO|nr:putative rRNA methylase [Mycetocola reblochoni REB411]